MAIKHATISAVGPGLRLLGVTGSGHSVHFDDAEGDSGGRPTEVLLAALGACSAMDVLSILRKKRQPVTWYRARVEGDQREEHPRVFTDIRVIHEVEGSGVDVTALRRAIELSASRYCSISATLSSGITRVSHWYVLRGAAGVDDEVHEVLVTGPHAAPGAPLEMATATAATAATAAPPVGHSITGRSADAAPRRVDSLDSTNATRPSCALGQRVREAERRNGRNPSRGPSRRIDAR